MSRADPADKLEKDLLKMPRELPGVTSLGFPSTIVEILQGEPDLWDFAQRIIADDLVLAQEWARVDGAALHQLMAQYDSPDGMAAFENRLIPSAERPLSANGVHVCAGGGGVTPDWGCACIVPGRWTRASAVPMACSQRSFVRKGLGEVQ